MSTAKRPSLQTPTFKGSFVHLAKPHVSTNDDGTEKEQYEITIVVPKDTPAGKSFKVRLADLLQEAVAEKHGPKVIATALKHYPIKDGDAMADGDDKYDNFRGHWMVGAKSNFKVHCIGADGDDLTLADELYSGAWYKAQVSAYAWVNKKGGKGVSVNLEAVIKIKDDTRIGGGANARTAFADDIGKTDTEDTEMDDRAERKQELRDKRNREVEILMEQEAHGGKYSEAAERRDAEHDRLKTKRRNLLG